MPSCCEQLGGAAGGDDFDAERDQFAGEFDQAGLVGNGNEGALDCSGMQRAQTLGQVRARVNASKS